MLFINFVANAECACHLALGWPLPAHVLDLSPAFRNLTNGRYTPEGKGLLGALRYYGFDNIASQAKGRDARAHHARLAVHAGRANSKFSTTAPSDVEALATLAAENHCSDPEFDLGVALYHGEFAAVSAADGALRRADRHGNLSTAGRQERLALRCATPWSRRSTRNTASMSATRAGDWTFNMERFAAYLAREGITGWPLLETGKLNMKRKLFEDMAKGWPQLEDLRQLRYARDKMRKVKLAVGADGRNRTVLVAVQGQDIAHAAESLAMDFLAGGMAALADQARAGHGRRLYRLLSHGVSDRGVAVRRALRADQQHARHVSGPAIRILTFAKRVGAVPRQRHQENARRSARQVQGDVAGLTIRNVEQKLWQLGLASRPSKRTRCSTSTVSMFAQYWQWSDDWVQHALQTGMMRTAMGWTCRIGITEFNERSIRNWPIQASGADILRIACIMAARHGIKLLAPVHDAVLIEAPIERIEADVALMQEIMRRASRIVLNADRQRHSRAAHRCNIISYPDRYTDKRGDADLGPGAAAVS